MEKHAPNPRFSQNFLINKGVIKKIVLAGINNIKKDCLIVEIGPGKGAITQEILLKKETKTKALEIDRNLIKILEEKFASNIKNSQLEIINTDVLKWEPPLGVYRVIANIPYHITGLILRHFLTNKNQPEKMVLLIQKEVAQRIVAKNQKESILSLSVKAFGEPKILGIVKKGSFFPSPKIDSAILEINNISRNNFLNKEKEELFFKLIKKSFSQKRKTLLKNISTEKKIKEKFELFLEKKNIDKKIRAEDLKPKDWLDFLSFT